MNTLSTRLLLLVGSALCVALLVALAGSYQVFRSVQQLDRIAHAELQAEEEILQATVAFKQQVQAWKNVLLRGTDDAALQRHWAEFERHEQEVREFSAKAIRDLPYDDMRTEVERFVTLHAAMGESYRRGLAQFRSERNAAAGDRAVTGLDREPTQVLLRTERVTKERGEAAMKAAVENARKAYTAVIIGSALLIAATLALLWWVLRRTVVRPILEARQFADRIAAGDLTASLQSSRRDEIGQLVASLGRMNEALRSLVQGMRSAAESVATASSQVATGTAALSQQTEEQASSLEETAASMEELASTVKLNADNAQEADGLARNASKQAEQSGEQSARVVDTIDAISDSARRIGEITSLIDGIAFQTNILALNAAVEAARAGEHGRGFAVVAAEVRVLAQRSAQAAREIKDLIGASVERVDSGSRLVAENGASIRALVDGVKRVSGLMAQIAEASAEQSRGVQQVNRTVTEMDKVVQQNASALQQTAAAAEALRIQARQMVEAVCAFRVGEGVAAATSPASASRSEADRLIGVLRGGALAAPPPALPRHARDEDWQAF